VPRGAVRSESAPLRDLHVAEEGDAQRDTGRAGPGPCCLYGDFIETIVTGDNHVAVV